MAAIFILVKWLFWWLFLKIFARLVEMLCFFLRPVPRCSTVADDCRGRRADWKDEAGVALSFVLAF